MTFIDPKTDYAFKKIFGSEQSKDILISFLNAILEFNADQEIVDVEILDPYQAPKIQGLKDTFLDVKVKTVGGKYIIIEMQVENVKGFDKRILYNLTKAYANQIEKGTHYLNLNPVIALTITDFVMFDKGENTDFNDFISSYILKEKNSNLVYNGDLEMVFVELPKFNKKLSDLKTIQDKWIYFIKEVGGLKVKPNEFKRDKPIQHAFDIASTINISDEELDILERQSIFIGDRRNAILLADERGFEKGMQRGIKEGVEKGVEKGIYKSLDLMVKSGIKEEYAKKILGI